jgi:hypothetical protein
VLRRRALLLAFSLLVPLSIVEAPAAHALDGACTETATGYSCLYGPIDVAFGENQIMDWVPGVPEAGYITSGRATLVDANNEPLAHHSVHLHHAVFLDPTREDMTCPYYPDRFFASGKERTKLELPEGYGYRWSNRPAAGYEQLGPIWLLIAHLDGMHEDSPTETWIRFNVGFTPESEATLTDVDPVWLDVRNCTDTDPVFTVRKGSGRHGRYRENWEYTMPAGGHFVTMAGHLHDGGIKLVLNNATTGSEVFTSVAGYDEPEEPWYLTSMSAYSGLPGIAVASGDRLRLSAVYDSTHTWRQVMGIMVGFLAP